MLPYCNNISDCGFLFSLLLKVPGFDEILVETINLCCHYYENHMYVMPKEKYILLKVSHFLEHVLLRYQSHDSVHNSHTCITIFILIAGA